MLKKWIEIEGVTHFQTIKWSESGWIPDGEPVIADFEIEEKIKQLKETINHVCPCLK